MQTIFDARTRDELLRRVDTIQPGSERQWGKMSAAQMLEHTARALEMASGRKPSKQALPGKLIGWMFRKSFVGEKPFGKNAPTGPSFIVRDEPALEPAREKVKELTQFKHVDHHLRQFGA